MTGIRRLIDKSTEKVIFKQTSKYRVIPTVGYIEIMHYEKNTESYAIVRMKAEMGQKQQGW